MTKQLFCYLKHPINGKAVIFDDFTVGLWCSECKCWWSVNHIYICYSAGPKNKGIIYKSLKKYQKEKFKKALIHVGRYGHRLKHPNFGPPAEVSITIHHNGDETIKTKCLNGEYQEKKHNIALKWAHRW